MKRHLIVCAITLLIAGLGFGQAITFTGDVTADFPASKTFIDPGGIDVGVPGALGAAVSGWDIANVGISYDEVSDTLFVGIDTFGIAGDADGDGDPSGTSPALSILNGTDLANLGGSESVAFAMDLNDDGVLDIVAGVPFGADISGFTVATYGNFGPAPKTNPYFQFDVPLPANVGTVFANPSAAAPDFEFTITNFSSLLATYAMGNTEFGILVFMGSLDDDGIGEDFVEDNVGASELNPCVPVPNLYQLVDIQPTVGGNVALTTYGVFENYGCCTIYSLVLSPWPVVLDMLPGMPQILVGVPGDLNSVVIIDYGVPGTGGLAVACKETSNFIPAFIPSGTIIYAQNLAYPALNITDPFYTSNTITIVQP